MALRAPAKPIVVSQRRQAVIPKDIIDELGLKPGAKLQAVVIGDQIVLVPWRSIKEMRGFLKGMDTTIEHEPDREI